MKNIKEQQLNISIEINGNEVFITEESSSGCAYEVQNLSELLGIICTNISEHYTEDTELANKEIFVVSLGTLLSLTRCGVKSCQLIDKDTLQIVFEDGWTKKVNIEGDSFLAIIKDVLKAL